MGQPPVCCVARHHRRKKVPAAELAMAAPLFRRRKNHLARAIPRLPAGIPRRDSAPCAHGESGVESPVMTPTAPALLAFLGWWELLILGAVLLIPALLVGVILLIVYLSRRNRGSRAGPPPPGPRP